MYGTLLTHSITRRIRPQALLDSPPPDPDAGNREDLTHLRCFTIDDAATTEVDDGLSLERLAGGGTRIWIHVADPTRWISPDTQLDLAGRQRGRTLYLPWGSVPMFPRALAEGPFSLRAGQVRAGLRVRGFAGVTGVAEVWRCGGAGAFAEVRIAAQTIRGHRLC